MQLFVLPNLIAIILLTVLILSGSISFLRSTNNFYKKQRDFVIFELPLNGAKSLSDILSKLSTPFTIEIAVSQLGKNKTIYLTLPRNKSRKVIDAFGAKEVSDYELYYPGGVVIGAHAAGKGSLKDFDVDSLDFSEINEIGEGAVVQFVMKKKSKDHFVANVRTLVSAPSLYQAKEIFTHMKASLVDIKLTEIKSEKFVDRVNSRTFNEKESITLST